MRGDRLAFHGVLTVAAPDDADFAALEREDERWFFGGAPPGALAAALEPARELAQAVRRAGMPNEPIELPFTIVSGLGVRDGGHTAFLRNLEVTLYPFPDDAPAQAIVFPVLLPPLGPGAVDVDIGDGAAITRLEIRGGTIYLSASVELSPVKPMLVALPRKRTQYTFHLSPFFSSLARLDE